MQQTECNLVNVARMIGAAAGYFQRSNRREIIADIKALVTRAPDRSMVAGAVVGLALGILLKQR